MMGGMEVAGFYMELCGKYGVFVCPSIKEANFRSCYLRHSEI